MGYFTKLSLQACNQNNIVIWLWEKIVMLGLSYMFYSKIVQGIKAVCMEEELYGYSWHK
jgi:hypothetical protein